MKLKEGFIVRKIANDTVLMDAADAGRLLRLNETAADILSLIVEGYSEAEIAAEMTKRYAVSEDAVAKDVANTVQSLKELGAIE